MQGYKHLIECNCVLPQYRRLPEPIFHKFVVFSLIDDTDTVLPKMAQCPNCGTVHKVYDICKSEIMVGKDETRAVLTVSDVSRSLPQQLVELLNEYHMGVADFEMAKYIVENQRWGDNLILSNEREDDGGYAGKMLVFVGPDKYRIDPFFHKDFV